MVNWNNWKEQDTISSTEKSCSWSARVCLKHKNSYKSKILTHSQNYTILLSLYQFTYSFPKTFRYSSKNFLSQLHKSQEIENCNEQGVDTFKLHNTFEQTRSIATITTVADGMAVTVLQSVPIVTHCNLQLHSN